MLRLLSGAMRCLPGSLILCMLLLSPAVADDKVADVSSADETVDTAASAVEIVPVDGFFDESFNDFTEDLETAKDEDKKALLIMFEMDECPFCHRMKTTVLNRSDVQAYFKEHFRVLSVDIEGDVEMTDFTGKEVKQKDFALKQFRVRATPVFQFIDLEGKPVRNARLTGATRDAEEFLLLGRYVAEGKTDKPFRVFKKEQAKSSPDNSGS